MGKNPEEKTLLDEFAMAALTGLCSAIEPDITPKMLAEAAYNIAEAMRAESLKRHKAVNDR